MRISLPPKPAASPTIKISVPPAGAAKAASTIKIPVPPKTAAPGVGIPKPASALSRKTPVAQKKEVPVAAAVEEAVATPMRKKARVKKAAPSDNTFDIAASLVTALGALGLAGYLWMLGQV
ncbi:MAG TPA: hypothetical protein EYG44_01145 [Verrucomicrobia bacterium]|nr:hypothetical protein [Verrucomicrobiota bacterium]